MRVLFYGKLLIIFVEKLLCTADYFGLFVCRTIQCDQLMFFIDY